MAKKTPRQELEELNQANGNEGFYGIPNQFAILIENRLYEKATKIMNDLNDGWLWVNERDIHTKIYNQLLDGISVNKIKEDFKCK